MSGATSNCARCENRAEPGCDSFINSIHIVILLPLAETNLLSVFFLFLPIVLFPSIPCFPFLFVCLYNPLSHHWQLTPDLLTSSPKDDLPIPCLQITSLLLKWIHERQKEYLRAFTCQRRWICFRVGRGRQTPVTPDSFLGGMDGPATVDLHSLYAISNNNLPNTL